MKKSKSKKLSDKFQKIEQSLSNKESTSEVEEQLFSKEQRAERRLEETKKQIHETLLSLKENATIAFNIEDTLDLGSDQLQFEIIFFKELLDLFYKNKSEKLLNNVQVKLSVNQFIKCSILIDLKKKEEKMLIAFSDLTKKFKTEFKQRSARYKVVLKESIGASSCKVMIEFGYDKDFKIDYLKNVIREQKMKNRLIASEEILLVVDSKERKKKIIKPNRNRESRIDVAKARKHDLDL